MKKPHDNNKPRRRSGRQSAEAPGSASCRWWVFATMPPDGNREYQIVQTKALAKKAATAARFAGGKDVDIIRGGKTPNNE